ncbi:MAG: DUF1501 domain-containing protein [Zavarzinella sp.]
MKSHLVENLSMTTPMFHRRAALKIGAVGAFTLPHLLAAQAKAGTSHQGKAKSIILLFNSGGIPHHETWDPKPDAPVEVRGDFGVISTKTPGLQVGELMPKTAQLTDKIAVIRTMVTLDNAHSTSGYQMLTGIPHVPLNRENMTQARPNNQPSFNALVRAVCPPQHGLPSSMVLPRRLANFDGLYPWPGTGTGILGKSADPWMLECDPAAADFTAPGCEMKAGLDSQRVQHRQELLQQLSEPTPTSGSSQFRRYQQQAFDMLTGNRAREAFDLHLESPSMRDRYGRSKHGQSVLLARRLVEAGVRLVQVNWASQDKKLPNGGGWDTHLDHSKSLKGWLMPSMDQTYSALITDLDQRGLLDETLVCWVAEFGHTPKFNAKKGRDHWGRVFSIALAGGGIRGGVVYGKTDKQAGEPLGDVVRPCDYLATLFHCLGFDPEMMIYDVENRPIPLMRGKVLHSILA